MTEGRHHAPLEAQDASHACMKSDTGPLSASGPFESPDQYLLMDHYN